MMGVPPSGPSNYGAPPPGISGGPPRPIGPGPPIYGPPAGPRSVPEWVKDDNWITFCEY